MTDTGIPALTVGNQYEIIAIDKYGFHIKDDHQLRGDNDRTHGFCLEEIKDMNGTVGATIFFEVSNKGVNN